MSFSLQSIVIIIGVIIVGLRSLNNNAKSHALNTDG